MARKKNHDEDYVSLEEILEKIKRSRIPTLTLDVKWQSIFNTEDKSATIAKLEKQLLEAMKSQGRITNDKTDLKKVKKRLMKEIMENMNSPENSRAEKKVLKSKELIEEINDKLILLEDEELDIPHKIREINAELALKSMSEIFDRYEENLEDIETLQEWVNETRIELKKRVMLLEMKKEENEKMDKYLSELIDGEIIRDYKRYREIEE